MKRLVTLVMALALMIGFTGCFNNDSKVVSANLSKQADNFQIERRIIFYNGITGEYMLNITGKCSVENDGRRLAVTCKTGNSEYKKHYLGLSDNVTYFAEQIDSRYASAYHYEVVFKPQTIFTDWDFKGSTSELPKTDNID